MSSASSMPASTSTFLANDKDFRNTWMEAAISLTFGLGQSSRLNLSSRLRAQICLALERRREDRVYADDRGFFHNNYSGTFLVGVA